MAASMTITESRWHQDIVKIKAVWVSAADGSVSGTTVNKYTGRLERLITIPSATAPTDNYDIAANDEDGYDVLIGAGANRDTANTEQAIASSLGCMLNSKLTFAVTNAGDSKGGTIILYISKVRS